MWCVLASIHKVLHWQCTRRRKRVACVPRPAFCCSLRALVNCAHNLLHDVAHEHCIAKPVPSLDMGWVMEPLCFLQRSSWLQVASGLPPFMRFTVKGWCCDWVRLHLLLRGLSPGRVLLGNIDMAAWVGIAAIAALSALVVRDTSCMILPCGKGTSSVVKTRNPLRLSHGVPCKVLNTHTWHGGFATCQVRRVTMLACSAHKCEICCLR